MMRRPRRTGRAAAIGGMLALALAACDPPGKPAMPEGPAGPSAAPFSHTAAYDLSGYYLPQTEVRIGKWSFDHLFVGQAAEFRAWEGGAGSETFAPVMLQFDDATSPMRQTEIGEARSITARVLPMRYSVSDTRITFEGRSPELGLVVFEGRLNSEALATSRRNLGDEGAVVAGTLKVGNAPARPVSLRWWMGD